MEDFARISFRASEIRKQLFKSAFIVISLPEMNHPPSPEDADEAVAVNVTHCGRAVVPRDGSRASQRTRIPDVLVLWAMYRVCWRSEEARKERGEVVTARAGGSWTEGERGTLTWKNILSKPQLFTPNLREPACTCPKIPLGGPPLTKLSFVSTVWKGNFYLSTAFLFDWYLVQRWIVFWRLIFLEDLLSL